MGVNVTPGLKYRAEKWARKRYYLSFEEVTQVGPRGFYVKLRGEPIPVFHSWEETGADKADQVRRLLGPVDQPRNHHIKTLPVTSYFPSF